MATSTYSPAATLIEPQHEGEGLKWIATIVYHVDDNVVEMSHVGRLWDTNKEAVDAAARYLERKAADRSAHKAEEDRKAAELLRVCRKFIHELDVHTPEDTTSDRVYEKAPVFLEVICDLIGYKPPTQ